MDQRHLQVTDPKYNECNERQDSSDTESHIFHPEYQTLQARISTFANWPLQRTQRSEQLAEAGFYYRGVEDHVTCFACDVRLCHWQSDDDPWTEHCRWFPACPYAIEQKGEQFIALVQPSVENERHFQVTDPEYNEWNERQDSSDTESHIRNSEYQTLQDRISTFANWPSQLTQRPEQLAEAGFYYRGVEDHVSCFACDVRLCHWETDDDPWTEHCRWFPACPYAIAQKGEQFIALVQPSVENDGYEASGGIDGLRGAMEQFFRLRDSEIEHIAAQHRYYVCLEMGFKEEDLKEAVTELRDRGNNNPALEYIIDLIDEIRKRKQKNGSASSELNGNCQIPNHESTIEENQRLRSIFICKSCGINNANVLFLPCTHHKLCMTCAESIEFCLVCYTSIREKIRTYWS